MRPELVVTSLGDAERDVAIDVTVTSPFSVKRTTVVPLTAAKKMEVSKKRKKYLEICRERWWTAFLSFAAIEAYGELQLMLQQQGTSLTLSSRKSKGLPQSTGLLVHPKLTVSETVTHTLGNKCQKGEAWLIDS